MKLIYALAAVLLLAAGTAWADFNFFTEPKVEYSAVQTMETEEGTITSTIFHAPQKIRNEMDAGGEKNIFIIRMDKKIMWTLMTDQKMYMEMSIEEAAAKSGKDDGYEMVEQKVVGDEKITGLKTTKSKMVMKDKKGNKFGGFMWTTKEGITVKLDSISVEKGEKYRIKMELNDLKIGKLDPALFEVPKGYEKMGMAGILMGGGKPGKSKRGKAAIDEETADNGPDSRADDAPTEEAEDAPTGTGLVPEGLNKLKNLLSF